MENLELKNDISYLTEKRNDELERFNDLIKAGETDERINNCFNSLLRKQKQVKLAEDALVIYNITKKLIIFVLLLITVANKTSF